MDGYCDIYQLADGLNHYQETETKIKTLTGLYLEDLLALFAKGYTLHPPNYTSFEELMEE